VELVCISLVAAPSIVLLIWAHYRGKKTLERIHDFVCGLGEDLGLPPPVDFDEGRHQGHALRGTIDGVPIRVTFDIIGRTTVRAIIDAELPAGFKLTKEGLFAELERGAGAVDVQLGNHRLDDTLMIGGDDPDAIRNLFASDEVRQAALRLFEHQPTAYLEDGEIELEFTARQGKWWKPSGVEEGESWWNPANMTFVEGKRRAQVIQAANDVVALAQALNSAAAPTVSSTQEAGKANTAAAPADVTHSPEPIHSDRDIDARLNQLDEDPVARFELALAKSQAGYSTLWLIVPLNILIYIFLENTMAQGPGTERRLIETGLDMGACFGPALIAGEWWRILTSNYLHWGTAHIFGNMVWLFFVGLMLERLIGRKGFLLVYTATGIIGAMTSVWVNPLQVAAGASGAVFGVYGAATAYAFPRGHIVPVKVLRKHAGFMAMFVLLQVFGAFESPHGVAHFAHIGGYVSGYLLGLWLSHPLNDAGRSGRTRRFWVALGTTALIMPIWAWLFVSRGINL